LSAAGQPRSSPTTRRLRIADAELTCLELPGEGPPFLLLHGLTGHREDFLHRLPDLAELPGAAHWLAPDLRGHGDFTPTGRTGTHTFERLTRDVAALLDACGFQRCDLLGHSFGGMVALRFALERPERVRSLVLLSSAPFAPEGYSAETFRRAAALAREHGMARLQELVEADWRRHPEKLGGPVARWADVYWPHHRRRYGAMDPVAYGELGALMAEQESVAGRLAEIRCPTSVIVGSEDTEFRRGSEALAEGIPGAELFVLAEAGHHPHMENPSAWLAAMRAHLARVPR